VHEMSIAESVLQIIEDKARADGYARVSAVWLEIGQLAGVETESLRFCFDVVTRDSVARDARQCGIAGTLRTLPELRQFSDTGDRRRRNEGKGTGSRIAAPIRRMKCA
jgi:hypothetical protein